MIFTRIDGIWSAKFIARKNGTITMGFGLTKRLAICNAYERLYGTAVMN